MPDPARRRRALRVLALALSVASVGACADAPRPPAERSAPLTTGGGRTLHVATTGDDAAAGTAQAPLGSLDHALALLRAGDTLVVHGGTYTERVDVAAAAGREDAPVRVTAAPGEQPVLVGLLWLQAPSWWEVSGLDVRWDDATGRPDEHMVKVTGGTDWVLSDAEVSGARSFAAVLVAGRPERFVLRRLHVHDTRPANGENEDHLVYLNSGPGPGLVEGCLLVGSPNGRAVKVGSATEDGDAVARVVLRYNTMVDNRGPSNVQLAWDARDVEVSRNVMVGPSPGRPNVTAFELRGGGNLVADNVGDSSAGVLDADVEGLEDGGGNLVLDPRLATVDGRPFVPTEPEATGYGHTALPDR